MHIESKKYFYILIAALIITDLAIILNIPFLRQILGFLFLTILPGLLILLILKLNKIDFLEKFILAWGLSISFLMFFGLLLNNSLFNLDYETPLTTISLLVSFNLASIVLAIIAYRTNKDTSFSLPNLNLTTSEKTFLVVPILFPALSVFGMHVMNTIDNNIILMFLLFLIPIYVVFVCFFNQKFPERLYPVVIFLISISLLLLLSLRSNHIIGMDVHREYYFFRTTLDKLHWSVFGYSTLDACLAISLLPTIYQSILNIRPEFLFKILYSLIFSISPLVIYIISKKYVGESYAFLASCFFMFQSNFLWTEYNARTNTAILFFALAMMTLFNDKIDPLKKRILFIVFMASCMVSHYSTTYVFFFILLGAFVGIEILSKRYTFKKVISLTIMILFFSMIFFWYSQVTGAAFNSGVSFVEETLSSLNEFFVEESRGGGTQAMFGEGIVKKGIPHKIEFVFTWLTFAFIGIGVITLIRRYKEMSFPELKVKKPDFLKDKFEVAYFVIALVCSGLLVAVITLPHISIGYSLDRLYAVAITILSVFFVIGGIMIAKYLNKVFAVLRVRGKVLMEHFFSKERTYAKKRRNSFDKSFLSKKRFGENALQVRAYLIILLVLIPYFLCVSGVMYNIFGVPRSIILNSKGEQYDVGYLSDKDVIAARWLGGHSAEKSRIYADSPGTHSLWLGYGKLSINRGSFIQNKTISNGYIYLRYMNVVEGKAYPSVVYGSRRSMTEYSHQFVNRSLIYNNGGSEVWK